jgi:exodeoxyribonuclease VII small subunit
MSEQKSVNDYIKSLEEVLLKIEAGDVALEESVKLYKEGKNILVKCQDMISTMEQEIQIIDKNK